MFKWQHAGALIVVVAVVFIGAQRIHEYHDSTLIVRIENTSQDIRELLSGVDIPVDAQIVILDMKTSHPGVIDVNSGYVRYLTGRSDIDALIGSDRYPLNPFKRKGSWRDPMSGLNIKRPIITYRYTVDGFERVDYLLRTVLNPNSKYPRLLWRLYDISKPQQLPVLVLTGAGLDEYKEFIYGYFADSVPFIAFSPDDLSSSIISESEAKSVISKGNLLSRDVIYSNVVTLVNVQKVLISDKSYFQLIVRLNDVPKPKFMLGCKIRGGKGIKPIESSKYASEGDYILFYHPVVSINMDRLEKSIKFFNVDIWPYKILKKQF